MSEANSKKNILIVDDDENVRVLCERAMRELGYITHLASSGLEALQFINENPQVDLVILDVRMPSLDGIQVLKQLRSKNINIPVIFYSDYSTYKDDFTTWLADAYLVKSSDPTKLKEKVKELLNLEPPTS